MRSLRAMPRHRVSRIERSQRLPERLCRVPCGKACLTVSILNPGGYASAKRAEAQPLEIELVGKAEPYRTEGGAAARPFRGKSTCIISADVTRRRSGTATTPYP